MTERYGYPHLSFMDREETVSRLGSSHYHFGIRDIGTGHIHPMKLVVGLVREAALAGANLYEGTKALKIEKKGGAVVIETTSGTITADRALIACNGYIGNLEPVTASHVMPIRSFIGATTGAARPYRDSARGRIGPTIRASSYAISENPKTGDCSSAGARPTLPTIPRDISAHIRRRSAKFTRISPMWRSLTLGGSVGITMPRQPFCREVMPGVTTIGGYSGHGVMLANYCGKLYGRARARQGHPSSDLLKQLKIPAFPGERGSARHSCSWRSAGRTARPVLKGRPSRFQTVGRKVIEMLHISVLRAVMI